MRINEGGIPDKKMLLQAIMARLGLEQEADASLVRPDQEPGILFEEQRDAGLGPIENDGVVPSAHVDMLAGGMPAQDPVEQALRKSRAPMREALEAKFTGKTKKLTPEEMSVIMEYMGPGDYRVE